MLDIEYENGLPKGYVIKRKKANIIYIISIYVYCLFNIILKVSSPDNSGYLVAILNSVLIIASLCTLFNYLNSRKNFKGIYMSNHDEVKVFTKPEIALYILPIAVMAVFIPLNMVIYFLIAGAFYLVDNKTEQGQA